VRDSDGGGGLAQLCQAAGPLDNWSRQGDGTTEYYSGVTYGGGRFVVVGGDTNSAGVIVTSPDGMNWTRAGVGTTNFLNDVCYGNGQFAAVGANGTIVVSPNGTDWIAHDSGLSDVLTSVAYGNGQFIAVGFSFSGLASATGHGRELPGHRPSLIRRFVGRQYLSQQVH